MSVLAAAGVGAAAAIVLALWLSRNVVAERVAVSYLRSRGVPANLHLTRLDAGGVAGALRIGPAGAPTLTVEHFIATFAPGTVLAGEPRVQSVLLIRPRLALRFDGRRLDFGALQPLIDEAMHAPAGKSPKPDVRIDDGRLRLDTPYGAVDAHTVAELSAGRLLSADLRVLPTALLSDVGAAEGLAGTATLRQTGGESLSVKAQLSALAVRGWGIEGRALRTEIDGVLPYRPEAKDAFAGHAAMKLSAMAASAAVTGMGTTLARATLALSGELTTAGGLRFVGAAEAGGDAARGEGAGIELAGPTIRVAASRLGVSAGGVAATGKASAAAAGGVAMVDGERVRLGALRAASVGRLHTAGRSMDGQAAFSLFAAASLNAPAASRLAARWAPGPWGADLRSSTARALQGLKLDAPAVRVVARSGVWSAALIKPVRVAEEGGGVLSLASLGDALAARRGAAGLTGSLQGDLAGGGFPRLRVAVADYSVRKGVVGARFSGRIAGSVGPLRGAAFALAGRIRADAHGGRVAADRCGAWSFLRILNDSGAPLAVDARGRLCPLPTASLLSFDGARWSAAASLADVEMASPTAKLSILGADTTVKVDGDAKGPVAATALLARATIRDAETPRRFSPLSVSGPVSLAKQRWSADIALTLAKPACALGTIRATQDQRSGAGGLTLDAAGLAFTPDGLQPAAVLPSLAPLATQVRGSADVTLTLGWGGEAARALVHVRTAGLQAMTAAGLATGIATDLTLNALNPLASPPGQVLTAKRVEGVLPLTDVVATYQFGGDAVTISSAQATLAGGRIFLDPMRVGLQPNSTIAGVVRADGVRLGELLDAVNLSRAVTIEAKIAGAVPFSLGPAGLFLTHGRLAAMEPGRLTLQRAALTGVSASRGEAGAVESPTAPPQSSAVQDFAFQALENLAFTELSAEVDSRPQGRVGVIFHIKGRHDPPQPAEARVELLDLIRGKAFDKPIPLPRGTEVNLTLDSSLNLDDLLKAYSGLSTSPGSAQVQP